MLRSYLSETDLKRLVHTEINHMEMLKAQGRFAPNRFDRVLVDVPCTADRHSLHAVQFSDSLFAHSRADERAALTKIQTELLTQAVIECKPGGLVVYSTCTLSPVQNEGVVSAVLGMFGNEDLAVESLEDMRAHFDYFFKFCAPSQTGKSMGLVIAPDIAKNFGPFYFCKLRKKK